MGRTSAGRALEAEALTAAVAAAIRHNHTCYDQLLMRGWSRSDARDAVRDVIDPINGFLAFSDCSPLAMVLGGKHTINIWLLQVVMSVEFLQH